MATLRFSGSGIFPGSHGANTSNDIAGMQCGVFALCGTWVGWCPQDCEQKGMDIGISPSTNNAAHWRIHSRFCPRFSRQNHSTSSQTAHEWLQRCSLHPVFATGRSHAYSPLGDPKTTLTRRLKMAKSAPTRRFAGGTILMKYGTCLATWCGFENYSLCLKR